MKLKYFKKKGIWRLMLNMILRVSSGEEVEKFNECPKGNYRT